MPSIKPGDVLLFGSFYALTGSLRRKLIEFVQHAKSNGAFIIYDPNFRSAHLAELDALRPWILENVSMADLVRGSDEDFRNIFDATTAFEAFQHVNDAGCPLLIYTRNSKGVDIISNGHARSYEVPQIKPLSTIGAGDSFNAGIIYAMVKDGDFMVDFSEFSWDRIIGYAVRFSADVCQNFDNYISLDFANQLK
jgi:fructokinase